MGCDTSTTRTARPVWSNTTTSDIFIPFTRVRENASASVRVSFLVERSSGLTITPAIRGTKDGWTYETVATWTGTAAATADGWTWGTAYTAPNDDYQEVEFGFNVKNTSSGDNGKPNCGLVTLVLDVRK